MNSMECRKRLFYEYKNELFEIFPKISFMLINNILKHVEAGDIEKPLQIFPKDFSQLESERSFLNFVKKNTEYIINKDDNYYISLDGLKKIEELYFKVNDDTYVAQNTKVDKDESSNATTIYFDFANESDKNKIRFINNLVETKYDKHKYIKPDKYFNMFSLYANLEEYRDCKFLYNGKIEFRKELSSSSNFVQNIELDIVNSKPVDKEYFVVVKSTICPVCKNIVDISMIEKIGNQNIRCPHHKQDGTPCRNTITLRDYDKKMKDEVRKELFIYSANKFSIDKIVNGRILYNTDPCIVKSFTKLKGRKNIVNAIQDNGIIYVLSRDYDEEKPLFNQDELDAVKVPENLPKTQLFKILYRLKNIVQEKFNLHILNRGEQLQAHLLLASIARTIYNYKNYHIFIMGDAGIAKTTPVKLLSPILFDNVEISNGGRVSIANMVANMAEKPPKPGQLATRDLMVYDEAARAFDINNKTRDYNSDLIPQLKNWLLEEDVSRDAGVGFRAPRKSTVVVLSNFNENHMMDLRAEIKQHYYSARKSLLKIDEKYENAEYNYDENWPLIVPKPEFFANVVNNGLIIDAHKQVRAQYNMMRREYATGLEYPVLARFSAFFIVENMLKDYDFDQYSFDPEFTDKIQKLNYEKMFYQFEHTVKCMFKPNTISNESRLEIEDYLVNDILKRYPNVSRTNAVSLDTREKNLYLNIIFTIMAIEKTEKLNDAVKLTFEILFKNNNTIISIDSYNMEENKDSIIRTYYINLLSNITTAGELIAQDKLYSDILNKLMYDKKVENAGTGYAVTEKGLMYLAELLEKKEKTVEKISDKVDLGPDKNIFDNKNIFKLMEEGK